MKLALNRRDTSHNHMFFKMLRNALIPASTCDQREGRTSEQTIGRQAPSATHRGYWLQAGLSKLIAQIRPICRTELLLDLSPTRRSTRLLAGLPFRLDEDLSGGAVDTHGGGLLGYAA